MNTVNTIIHSLKVKGGLTLVNLKAGAVSLKAIVIETPDSAPYLKEGAGVKALFKETELIISRDMDPEISLRNRFVCRITAIEKGELLSKLNLETEIPGQSLLSVITSDAVLNLNLIVGDTVLALVKTNEIILSE